MPRDTQHKREKESSARTAGGEVRGKNASTRHEKAHANSRSFDSATRFASESGSSAQDDNVKKNGKGAAEAAPFKAPKRLSSYFFSDAFDPDSDFALLSFFAPESLSFDPDSFAESPLPSEDSDFAADPDAGFFA
jgi:hypothetical protein